ncbi:hypothetical protein C464_17472 [Halorubrum coriense DSM 10284]|uniref:DUF8160 domain-containing protein n=1 Tax=Halorubrum coriense DSM 10284 TaxID=1227466 RepID=M0E6H8_9EURY|nr:hypothetical protein [Halorubrum coriense]ELZ42668.1 hypothetical protein C464_17472 [Halorubrum coriense DSM 10284]
MTDGDGKRDRNPWDDRYDRDDDDRDNAAIESEASSETTEMSEASNTSETSKKQKTTKMSKSKKTAESEESNETVRERKNVNMYLPEGLVDDLQMRYSELNVEWRRRHGEDMPKNDEFYPAAIRAALGESSIEEELGLGE